jgi:hypothetical protein
VLYSHDKLFQTLGRDQSGELIYEFILRDHLAIQENLRLHMSLSTVVMAINAHY